MKDRSAWSTARREALEEAGVRGQIHKTALGAYRYMKRASENRLWACKVIVFPLRVEVEEAVWLEVAEGERHWFSRDDASAMVDEEDLSGLIRGFDPRKAK